MRNVRVDEDEEPYRKSSTATIRSEGTGTQYYSKHGGIQPMYDSSDNSSLDSYRSSMSQMRIRRVSSSFDGSIRFPKLQECAHFHYDIVELPDLKFCLCDEEQENYHHNGEEVMERSFLVKVTCNQKSWNVKRTFKNFRMLDRQLHRCIFDRRFSRLPDLQKDENGESSYQQMEEVLSSYMEKLTELAGSNINCGTILNWFELDNRGNRLLVVDDSGINTPAIAAAHAVKRYTAQAVDEISLEVGDIVSVIDMPSPEDTLWWRGKRGFEVGFFPNECVEVIGDKVPVSMQTNVPLGSNSKKPLVRKHGKFLSFLRMFFSTRPARIELKQSGIVKERVFGCDLGEHLLNSGHDVPLVLKSCSEFIEEYGIVDGIYRLSGITSNIQKIRHAFDEDRVPDLTEDIYLQDIHSISSLLKMYFRELPNPLLTYQLYDKFADAVRDEDNKLWKIHDVVQQLPPPHYRTTEYLMRHLAKVAAFGSDTGMHSKNLAIVWAPNLLRSKELECGGGAAALQGVGIQAVVTECLILYADLIFSDKMPSYSSPELKNSRKKPRPKSLAISTPTKLITLEEARERALSASLRPPSQKYIDVGGGPKNLPDRYHTVIDLPGYRKKAPLKDVGNIKGKKSPSGWRSIFSKSNRHGNVKHKALKGSVPDSLGQLDRKAITEEDVHNWKRRRLRGAKSAESLVSFPDAGRDSRRMSQLIDENLLLKMYSDEKPTTGTRHKRSLSSESPRNLINSDTNVTYPSFIMTGSREVGIDVDTAVVPDDSPEISSKQQQQQQSFVRNETKRRVVTHRKSPSAPSTPRQDSESREKSHSPKMNKQKALASAHASDSKEIKIVKQDIMSSAMDSEKFVLRVDDANILKPRDSGAKSANLSKDDVNKAKKAKSPPIGRKETKTPPRERRKSGEDKKVKTHVKDKSPSRVSGSVIEGENKVKKAKEIMTIDLPESPGAKRKHWIGSTGSTPATTPDEPPTSYYFSRNHDYAEILSDSEDRLRRADTTELLKADSVDANRLSDSYDNLDPMFFLPHSPVDQEMSMETRKDSGPEVQYAKVLKKPASFDESNSKENIPPSKIQKCLSVPSDIQKSLENLNSGSQTDMLSSVTISELSTSVESFNLPEDGKVAQQNRRSASLDSLTEKDSPLTRTLIEINAQIDRAFKSEVERAKMMKPDYREQSQSSSYEKLSLKQTSETPELESPYDNFHTEKQSGMEMVETPRLLRAPLRPGTGPDSQNSNQKIVKQSSLDSSVFKETCYSSNGSASETRSVFESHSKQYSYVKKESESSGKVNQMHYTESTNSSEKMESNSSLCSPPIPAQSVSKLTEELALSHSTSNTYRGQQQMDSDCHFNSQISSPTQSQNTGPPHQGQGQTWQNLGSPMQTPIHPSATSPTSITSPLTSPVGVQRRPRSIHRGSSDTASPQGHMLPPMSPSSSPGQARSTCSSSQGSSPFMSPSSPHHPRGFDVRRTQSRHGKVTFDLSEEDLNFLSEQGKKQTNKSDCQMSSSSSSLTSSPESKLKKEDVEVALPTKPARRDFPHLLLSSVKSSDPNSSTSSPRSPRQHPRWEDLAGLNQDFRAMAGLDKGNSADSSGKGRSVVDTAAGSSRDNMSSSVLTRHRSSSDSCVQEDSFERKLQDLSDFNEIWRKQLAPTGDVCRSGDQHDKNMNAETRNQEEHVTSRRHQLKKSSTIAAMELVMDHCHQNRERTPECSMEERVLVMEKPMIKKCLTESDIPQIRQCNILTQDSASTTSSSGTSDLSSIMQDISFREMQRSRLDDATSDKTTIQRNTSVQGPTAVAKGSFDIQSSDANPKPSKIQKMDTKDMKLNMPVLPPLELSGFPQFENSGLTPTTGATLNHLSETESKNKRDSDVTVYENDPLPDDLDICDFGNIGTPNVDTKTTSNQESQMDTGRQSLEEFDINESCFGIPSHQNLSNEMRERAQERIKATQMQLINDSPGASLQGVETMSVGAPFVNPRITEGREDSEGNLAVGEERAVLVQEGSNMALHVGMQYGIVPGQTIPNGHFNIEATVQYGCGNMGYLYPSDDIFMLSQGPIVTAEPFVLDQLEPHNTVALKVDNTEEAAQNEINADLELSMTLQNSLNQENRGWEYEDVTCQKSAPAVSTPGLSHMKLVSPAEAFMETGTSRPPVADLPELAPPTREFMEVSRSRMVRSRPKPHIIVKPISTLTVKEVEAASDKGESEVVVEHRVSFKKKAPIPLPKAKSLGSRSKEELVDPSEISDDVFVDDVKSNITQTRLLRRPCGSLATFVFPAVPSEPSNRSSLDESVLQMASSRHDDFASDDSDSGKREDIRFTRAHRSAKLQSLKELFEKSCSEQSMKVHCDSDSQEKLFCAAKSSNLESLDSVGATAHANLNASSQMERSHKDALRTRSSPLSDVSTIHDNLNSPRSRRSISTDTGYEYRSGRMDISQGVPMTAAKPPKHRSTSKNRTPSESSMSEIESKVNGAMRGSPKSCRQDGSPRSIREGSSSTKSSPKSQREASPIGFISGDDSPRSIRNRTDGSPRGMRHVSFQRTESFEQVSPKNPRSWSNSRSVTIDTVDFPLNDRSSNENLQWQTSELWKSQRSRRAVSMETGEQRAGDLMSKSLTNFESQSAVEGNEKTQLERKGSIKELMNFFENKTEGQGQEEDAEYRSMFASSVQRTRQRVHSVSPTVGLTHMSRSTESLGVSMRHSLELPSDLDLGDSLVRPQPVRIGPKPFYGTQL